MVIYSGVCYTQRKFFGDKDAYKMNSERLMNEQRLALLKTIRKENPSLRRYMNDIINEMENPESAFNTGKMTQSTDLDRTTAIRLCDAFAVAKMYSEKYHLDFPELIEFVSEKTLEILSDGKITLTAPFKERMKYLIRQQFPFRNALLSRSGCRNMLFYELADKEILDDSINENKDSCVNENRGLEIPILFTNNANASYSEIEFNLEHKEVRKQIDKALKSLTPREEEVICWRFGLNDGEPRTLEEVGNIFGMSREYIRLREAKAIRKLHSRKCLSILSNSLDFGETCNTPIGRGTSIPQKRNKYSEINNLNILYWQPYCTCGHQMRYRVPVLIAGKWKEVFYCRNCGRIYEVKNEKLKRIPWYCLKGYTLDSSLDKERWAVFHWDATRSDDFNERLMNFYLKNDLKYYREQIAKVFSDNYALKEAMNAKITGIYSLASKRILLKEDAQKCVEMLIREYCSNQ